MAPPPVVLVSAGVGCAPMTGVPAHLASIGSPRPLLFPHAGRSPVDHALRTETGALVKGLPGARSAFRYEHAGPEEPDARSGLMDLSEIELPDEGTVFLCDPLPFIPDVRGQLPAAGVSPRRIRYEVFGPGLWLPGTAA
ncbi:hypothetical protein ACLQ18_42755 [Streptomyces sp. DT193]|uniref:hypothetical protein n=1 Tax=Streptomyces sp. DT193 TaxID=3393418 RepID=UPI003CF6AC9E